ncbi:MAG: hypothetical protein EOP62_00470 [Sphingomonadales bacterium]|nr:MAG: hypothetical protein EOP62_00470 [Sphingomonadales bacterium]
MDEIARFPVYELDDQGSRSLARYLVAMNAQLLAVRLVFDNMAATVEGEATDEERDTLVEFLVSNWSLCEKCWQARN